MFFLISGALAYVSLATECLYQAIAPDEASLDLPSVRANLRVAYQEFLAVSLKNFIFANYLFVWGVSEKLFLLSSDSLNQGHCLLHV